ncbi:MAG: ComEC/Rec2 family competence protein [Armatimonadota bacterium]|jgi:competence protein ComEC
MPEQSADRPPATDVSSQRWLRTLTPRPLMLCCLALIGGIALAHLARPGIHAFALVALGSGVVVAASGYLSPRTAIAPVLVGAFALGGLAYEHRSVVPPTDLSHLAGSSGVLIEGTIIRPPGDGGWQRRVRVEVAGVSVGDGAAQRATGRVEARVPSRPELEVGDRVHLRDAAVALPESAEEPGEFDYRGWLARQGVRSVASARAVEVIGTDDSLRLQVARRGQALRAHVVEAIEGAMPGPDAAFYSRLMLGMVYGLGGSRLPEEVAEQFRRTGTVHLLVVSGAQVSMLAMVLVGLTGGGLRRMRWWQAILASFGVLVLVAIVGMEASVSRAVAMFALVVLAALGRRDYDVYTAIALAAAVILLVEPFALLSLSFQLTFAATLGIVLFLPDEPIRRIDGSRADAPLPQIRSIVWASFGAWALTTPLLAHSFAGFALTGSVANLTNVPLRAVVLVLGFAALPVALVPALAPALGVLCAVARGVIMLMMHITELAAGLPMPFLDGAYFSPRVCVAWYAAAALVLLTGLCARAHDALDRVLLRPHPSTPVVGGFVLATALICTLLPGGLRPGALEVTLLPVGAGQCAVARAPSGATVMIDCGGGGNHAQAGREVAEGVVIPWLVRRKIDRIDVAAISHWDADHCNALEHVLSAVPAGLLLVPPDLPGVDPPAGLRAGLRARPQVAAAGGAFALGEEVVAEVLAPRMPLIRGTGDDPNENSIVIMLTHGDVRVLITGDIAERGATRLVRDARNAGRSLRADLLVLPHHGRRLGEVEVLLDAVRPRWAIASSDRRADEYMGAAEMALLTSRGIRLLRTDIHGAITVLSDGRRARVTASRGPRSLGSRVAAAQG